MIRVETEVLALSDSELESAFIIATNDALSLALEEFEFRGYVVTVESALSALRAIVECRTLH